MNLQFKELKCPKCSSDLEQGSITCGHDVQMVKRCPKCDFWMIIIIPHEDFEYKIVREIKHELKKYKV